VAPSQCGKRRTKRIRRGIILGRNNRESESGKRHSFWSMRTSITAAGEISSGSDQPRFPPAAGLQRQTLAPISFLVPRIAAAWRNWWGFAALGPDCRKVTSVKFTLGCVVGEAGHERGAVRCGALHGLELFRRAAAAREKEMERRNTAGVVGLTLGGAAFGVSAASAVMSISAELLGIRRGGDRAARCVARLHSRAPTPGPLPPLGRQRLRSGPGARCLRSPAYARRTPGLTCPVSRTNNTIWNNAISSLRSCSQSGS